MNLTIISKLPGHPRFVAHAYPPEKGHWWQGNYINQLMQRATSESSCFGRSKEIETLEKYTMEPKRRPKLTAIKGIGGIG
jgi:hypothetical protein